MTKIIVSRKVCLLCLGNFLYVSLLPCHFLITYRKVRNSPINECQSLSQICWTDCHSFWLQYKAPHACELDYQCAHHWMLLNGRHAPATVRIWFLKIVSVCVCVWVCVYPWGYYDLIWLVKQVLQLLYGNWAIVVSIINGGGLGIDMHQGN